MKNERGEAVSMSFLVLLIILSTLILYGYLKVDTITTFEHRLKFTLCLKEYNEVTKELIRKTAKSNSLIKKVILGEVAVSTATLGSGAAAARTTAEYLKKALKARQTIANFSYMKNMATLKLNGCPLPITNNITPYKFSNEGFFEQRNLRINEWKILYKKEENYGAISYKLINQEDANPEITTFL